MRTGKGECEREGATLVEEREVKKLSHYCSYVMREAGSALKYCFITECVGRFQVLKLIMVGKNRYLHSRYKTKAQTHRCIT